MMRLLSLLLSISIPTVGCRTITAGQNMWSGAGSNCRPSAFQAEQPP